MPQKKAGESFTLTITSPAMPEVSSPPAWINATLGSYKNYKMQVTLKVAANETYEARTANLTVSASGTPSVTLTVSQKVRTGGGPLPIPPIRPREKNRASGENAEISRCDRRTSGSLSPVSATKKKVTDENGKHHTTLMMQKLILSFRPR